MKEPSLTPCGKVWLLEAEIRTQAELWLLDPFSLGLKKEKPSPHPELIKKNKIAIYLS